MIKIANIVGARPQFIKYFPVSKAVERSNSSEEIVKDILIHTGQHYDYNMSRVFFDELGIRQPDYHLGVGSGTHGQQTGQIIQKVEEVLLRENPDVVLVYGDTNSTLGSAIAASKLHICVAHVEAGLRSYNKNMPEEINRVLTDHISDLLFCPSRTAVTNLAKEGFKNALNGGAIVPLGYSESGECRDKPLVMNVGDVMYDVLLYSLQIAEQKSTILEQLHLATGDYYFLTLHRAENTDRQEKIEEVISFVNDVSGGKTVIFPMHPRTRKVYEDIKRKFAGNTIIIEPLSYFDTLTLLKNSTLVMTDSGGVQKEAFWLKTPCITLRDETEWVETVESGWNVLYKNYNGFHKPSEINDVPYGDGEAAKRIVSGITIISKGK